MSLLALLSSLAVAAAPVAAGITVIPGGYEPGKGPDGNSVVIEGRTGLILVDTGRHPEHRDRLLEAARAANKPVAAIFNTHWHLDHAGQNAAVRAAFPKAPLYASRAIEGALTGFLAESRKQTEAFLASGKATPVQVAEIRLGFEAMDDPDALRPTRPVTGDEDATIGGRRLRIHLARHAATEGDVWIEDRATKTVIAGDLVVAMVPFMDTACTEGWRRALDTIAAADFRTLIPGHGDPMTKAQFLAWRTAFNTLADCGAGDAAKAVCVAGWLRDAAAFIPPGETRVPAMVEYYIDSRLRVPPAVRDRYCAKS